MELMRPYSPRCVCGLIILLSSSNKAVGEINGRGKLLGSREEGRKTRRVRGRAAVWRGRVRGQPVTEEGRGRGGKEGRREEWTEGGSEDLLEE